MTMPGGKIASRIAFLFLFLLSAAVLAAQEQPRTLGRKGTVVKVNNLTSHPLLSVYWESEDSGDASDNVLPEGGIGPWEYVTFELDPGAYVLRAVFEVGGQERALEKEITVEAGRPCTWAIEEDREPVFSEAYDPGEENYEDDGGYVEEEGPDGEGEYDEDEGPGDDEEYNEENDDDEEPDIEREEDKSYEESEDGTPLESGPPGTR